MELEPRQWSLGFYSFKHSTVLPVKKPGIRMKKIRGPRRTKVKLSEDPLINQLRIPKSQLRNLDLLESKEIIMF